MHELRTMLEVETPLGWGHALLVESTPAETYWTVILADTLGIVTFRQDQLRVCRNYTMNWKFPDSEMRDIIKGKK